MGEISLEPSGQGNPYLCPHCGNESHTVWGYVRCDGNAYAVYYVGWTTGHDDMGILIGMGEWGEGTTPSDRYSVALTARAPENQIGFMVVGPGESLLDEVELLGRLLTREDALAHPQIQDVFRVADHIVSDDPRVAAVL
jgi:hypothetical protein